MSTGGSNNPASRVASAATNRRRLISAARAAFARQGYASASMDEMTAAVGLTRGALYHGFGSKQGLLAAVIAELDAEMAGRLADARRAAPDPWSGLLAEGVAYVRMALDPEIQRIMLLDGPAVLGDPSTWPGEQACLEQTISTLARLRDDRVIKPLDVEAAARLFNGAALTAALWVAAADDPLTALPKAIEAFCALAEGLLAER
ncbi:TetR/AcrR family transcriptional regulator [Sphingopyxis sp. JAI108]|uniref:TetR/AcrR family transcriptional regulator n=1 Tax=Sphingopyxis sp. JAI108 TaxID=2723060 RepID=UPI0015CCFB88|nr:TetR/AcrR family transcriptional regulator [Sphingopyxis sp. JAI108]